MRDEPREIELKRDFLGSYEGEALISPGQRVPVRYVPYPDDIPLPEIERQVREVVERVARDEELLRRRAADAWLPSFHEECPPARGWTSDRLARSFTLRGIILGSSHPTFILEYETALPVEHHPKTWFHLDGSVSHVSGHLD